MIEKIVDNDEWENIKSEYLNKETREQLKKKIFSGLTIKLISKNKDLEDDVEKTLDSMIDNYYNGQKNQKLFSLSELYIPMRLASINNDLKWIYWNQCFNNNGNPKSPALGTDCVFIYKNEKIIINEIKSSSQKTLNYSNISSAIDEINDFFNVNKYRLSSLLRKLRYESSSENEEFLSNINKNSFDKISFLISTFNINTKYSIESINVKTKELNSLPLSFYEMRINKNDK